MSAVRRAQEAAATEVEKLRRMWPALQPETLIDLAIDIAAAYGVEGFVWCNPPFSNTTPWAERMLDHDNGIFLGPFANARWTQLMLREARVTWLMRDFAFDHPLHAGKRSSMPLAMYAFGRRAERALHRASRAAPDAGRLVTPAGHREVVLTIGDEQASVEFVGIGGYEAICHLCDLVGTRPSRSAARGLLLKHLENHTSRTTVPANGS